MISNPTIPMRYWTLAGPLCGTDLEPKHPRARVGHRPGPANNEEIDRGCPEAEDVAQQYPLASFAVEDHRADAGGLQQPCVRRVEAAPSGMPHLRAVQGSPGRRGL